MLSRVAESLYWMARYSERAEHVTRLLDVQLNLSLDSPGGESRGWPLLLATLGTDLPDTDLGDPYAVARALTFDMENPASLVWCITRARENARQVRDLISSEMWEQLNELYLYVHRADTAWEWSTQPYEFFGEVREGMHILQGITDSTMQYAEGWQFIQVGRFLERASEASSLVGLYFGSVLGPEDPWVDSDRYLDWVALLKSFAAFEAYCKVYTADLRSERIAEFLVLDSGFPHSVRFAVDRLETALHAIAAITEAGPKAAHLHRLIGRLAARLRFSTVEELLPGGMSGFLDRVREQCGGIHAALAATYIDYPIEAELSA